MPPRSARGAHGGRRRGGHGGGHEEGGSERWLVTYADMLTLLLVLFIVLFSISVVNTSKFISLKTSLASAFGSGQKGIVSGGTGLLDNDAEGTGQQLVMPGAPVSNASPSATSSASPSPTPTGPAGEPLSKTTQDQAAIDAAAAAAKAQSAQTADYSGVENSINKALSSNGLTGDAKFTITSRGLVITVVTNALVFPGNSADLEAQGQQIMAAIAPALRKETRSIEVDGYTNQENVSTYPYPSGWELSSARASAVVRTLIADGVPEAQLAAVGYSDQHPLYPPSSPLAATLNRRVEIVVLSSLPAGAGSSLPTATPSK